MLAGVVPCAKGWLVFPGKLVGISLHPEPPVVAACFTDVIDTVPSYDVVAVAAPIGLHRAWTPGGRRCDRQARGLLGWPRLGAIASPPGRDDLADGAAARVDAVSRRRLARIRELDREMQPYRQRTVYAAHPELSFLQINGDRPLVHRTQSPGGVAERRALLAERIPGVEPVLTEAPPSGASVTAVLDAAAVLWTSRRIAARAAIRIPDDPEWDDTGLRMEWVR